MAIPNPCIQIPSQGRLRTDKRRTQIVEVVIYLIAHHGLREFKAVRIAEVLEVTTGALFRHFESMTEIAEAVVAHIEGLSCAESLPSNEHPLERLEMFFKQRVQVIHDSPAISRILLSDQVIDSAEFECFKQLRECRKRTGSFVKQCINDAQEQQLLNGIVSVEDAAVLVVGAVFALAHSPVQPGDTVALRKQGERIWRALYHNFTGEFPASQGNI